jgi:predicted ATP-grasp superfamily ATP-dependent carboligase
LIAPEFDGHLHDTAQSAVNGGGKLISPGPEFIRIAAEKHQTCERLAAKGVNVPRGVLLEPDEPLPTQFPYPAVLKPNNGAGSQDTYLVSGRYDAPPAYAWPRRLEQFVPGLAASVSFLCGKDKRVPLAPCAQRLSDDGRFRYLGGRLPLAAGLETRAVAIASRALDSMPAAHGYVGVDLVLGRDPHGSEDAVIEINPRMTTSYVGLRAATDVNLAEAMLSLAAGDERPITFQSRPLEFDCEGNVSFA